MANYTWPAPGITGKNDPDVILAPTVDAFNRSRVSQPVTLFDSKQIFNNQPHFWVESLEVGATSITAAHSAALAATTITYDGTGEIATYTRQTRMRFNYQPGKSQLILMTGVLSPEASSSYATRRMGYFDDNNGVFLEDSGGTYSFVVRSSTSGSPVDTKTNRSSWNIDVFDGTGPSGITLDFSKTQILVIDFEWLGVGSVRFGFVVDGVVHYAHVDHNANSSATVYMSTPNLPLRYQLISSSADNLSANTLVCICATVISEGGSESTGHLMSVGTNGTHIDLATENTLYPVLALRLDPDNIGATVDLESVEIFEGTGSKAYQWMVIFNPTIASGALSFSDVPGSHSDTEYALGNGTLTASGGDIIAQGFAYSSGSGPVRGGTAGGSIQSRRRLGALIDGTPETLVLCIRPINGSTAIDIEAAFNWKESQ